MTLAAGHTVIAGADLSPGQMLTALPFFGTVESVGAGSPPVDTVVAWENGTRISYAVSQAGSSPIVAQVLTTAQPPLVGFIVDPLAVFLPNPGGRLRGEVVMQFQAALPDGTTIAEFIFVRCAEGYYTALYANVVVVDAA